MQKQKQSGKKLKKPNLHFGQENCSKARYLEHLSNLLSSVTLKRVSFIKPFTHSVNWQREQLSEMNRSHANPFFSVPLIGSLIYCHRTLQEGEACVGGWVQRERERELWIFGTWCTLAAGHTYCWISFVCNFLSLCSILPSFLLFFPSPFFPWVEVSPSGGHPNDFTAQHESLTHSCKAEVFLSGYSDFFFSSFPVTAVTL